MAHSSVIIWPRKTSLTKTRRVIECWYIVLLLVMWLSTPFTSGSVPIWSPAFRKRMFSSHWSNPFFCPPLHGCRVEQECFNKLCKNCCSNITFTNNHDLFHYYHWCLTKTLEQFMLWVRNKKNDDGMLIVLFNIVERPWDKLGPVIFYVIADTNSRSFSQSWS